MPERLDRVTLLLDVANEYWVAADSAVDRLKQSYDSRMTPGTRAPVDVALTQQACLKILISAVQELNEGRSQ